MSVELHLPDLPEVPISLGIPQGRTGRTRLPWHLRARDVASSYLPLLLMALLALATWWLVKHSPQLAGPAPDRPVSPDPDYMMSQFAIERFDAKGRLRLRIDGTRMRHFPAIDRIEIEGPRIRAIASDGRVTLASAQRAIGAGDGSEMQLIGDAQVSRVDDAGSPLLMRGEFLHADLVTERVRSHLPVRVQVGGAELRAGGLEYDHAARRLELKGPMRAEFPPRVSQ
jgi:lipopolysaccharide export system protein LptC